MARKPYQNPADEDELFFEMMKDEFTFFYALTIAVMDMLASKNKDSHGDNHPQKSTHHQG